MTAALAKRSINANALRKEAQEIALELRTMKEKAEHKLVRLANIAYTVQQHKLWKEWKDLKTGKLYTGISQWIHGELGESRTSVYRFISVRKYLKDIPDGTLEKIGNMRCFELVKVAVEKPTMLPRFVRELEKNPDMPVFTLQQRVTNALAGSGMDSGQYERLEFAVKVEDLPYINKALAVMQAMEAVKSPETAAGRGMHLVALAQEYLTGAEQTHILKNLEAAGAFNGSFAKIED